MKLFHEKRTELEEQQLHLNIGLNKIRETQEQVKELQKSLSAKTQELEAKNSAANAKLKQMVRSVIACFWLMMNNDDFKSMKNSRFAENSRDS